MLLALLLGCLDPFPTDRHDLVELRIAGMAVDLDDPTTTPERAFVWEGTEAWSAVAPGRAWTRDARDCGGDTITSVCGTFSLSVTGADGATESGALVVGKGAITPVLGGFFRALGDAGANVSLDVPEAAWVHWMAPAGEILETGFAATTYTAPVDDEGAPKAGIWPLVALWLDGLGGNDWATFDVPVGVDGPFFAVGGRLFPVDTELPSGATTVLATVSENDDLTGFSLTDVVADDGSEEAEVVCGCGEDPANPTTTWNPDSVIERLCGRDEVAGARVRITGEIVR